MKIRKALKSDCVQIYELWKELGKVHSNYMNEKECKLTEDNFYFDLLDNNECSIIVAINEKEIVGYIEYYMRKDQKDENYWYILHAYIKPNYRNSDVAIKLFTFLKNEAKKKRIKSVYTDVYYNNAVFYKSIRGLGFKPYKTKFRWEIE